MEAALALFQSLTLGQLAQHVLNLLLQGVELFQVAGLDELGQLLQVDNADLSSLGGFLQLLEQFVDQLQFLLDFQGLLHRHRGSAGEVILGGQLVHLVLLAQALDQLEQLPGERPGFLLGGVPEPFQVVQLLIVDGLIESAGDLRGRLHLLGQVVVTLAGLGLGLAGLVGGQDLAFRSSRMARMASRLGPSPRI